MLGRIEDYHRNSKSARITDIPDKSVSLCCISKRAYASYHSLLLPLFRGAVVGEDLESRAPLLQLHLPIEHHAGGHHNQVGAPHTWNKKRMH